MASPNRTSKKHDVSRIEQAAFGAPAIHDAALPKPREAAGSHDAARVPFPLPFAFRRAKNRLRRPPDQRKTACDNRKPFPVCRSKPNPPRGFGRPMSRQAG
ncbi:hypothetical protein QZM22_23230 [Burkholderia oklahomensis]|uniref:hypothetical protein n=1 Tax=Burkholderia oklahomensis TaxID=342113 RepID=UPI0026569187|nr:hypothetical protein [Burkholderia oklahomensis]MDN7675345.1 hypothetical protein [Burkholderia oklahomensis]